MRVAGIDGTRDGWVAIVLEEGAFAADLLLSPIQTTLDALADCAVIGIDIPIGYGPRSADGAARRCLGAAAKSTVFSTPTRDQIEKKSAGGALERIGLLRQHGVFVDAIQHSAAAPLDDVLDAAAAAWTAQRIASGFATPLPDPPELVDTRRVAIWY